MTDAQKHSARKRTVELVERCRTDLRLLDDAAVAASVKQSQIIRIRRVRGEMRQLLAELKLNELSLKKDES